MTIAITLASVFLASSSFFACTVDEEENMSTTIVVTLHFTKDSKVAEALKLAEKFRSVKGIELLFRPPQEGKGIYAEVSTSDTVSVRKVSYVVEELLRNGIREISIEVKKM